MATAGSASSRWAFVCVFSELLSLVAAQCQGSHNITGNPQKIEDFFDSDCPNTFTYEGDLTLERILFPSSTVNESTKTLPLGSIQTFQGSLEFKDISSPSGSGGWTVNGDDLQNVWNNLTFSDLEEFDVPHFTQLSSVGALTLYNVEVTPTLVNYSATWPELTHLATLNLTNTNIPSFELNKWLTLPIDSTYEDVNIVAIDNSQLKTLQVNGYEDTAAVLVRVDIHDNNQNMSVSFPNMAQGVFDIRGVGDLDAPAVTALGSQNSVSPSDVQAISSNSFSTLSLPNLATTYGTVEIDSNPSLSTLDLSNLTTVTSLRITNNPRLRNITLPKLQFISSSIYIDGPVDQISAPLAVNVLGTVTINTYGSFNCKSLNITQASGTPSCKGVPSPTSTGSHSSSTGSGTGESPQNGSNGGGGLTTGAKIGIGVGVGVGVLAIAAILIFCCMRRRKNRSTHTAAPTKYYNTEPKGVERSQSRYTKVPANSGSVDHSSESRVSPSSALGDNWAPPEQRVPTTSGRVEMEEQQGYRHEMDARSLQDMDLDDDREETRSLEDIERAHGHT